MSFFPANRGMSITALLKAGLTHTPEYYVKSSDSDFTAAFLRALDKKPGVPILLTGDYPTKLTGIDKITDQDVHLIGTGNLVQSPGFAALTVERTAGTPIAVNTVDLSSVVVLSDSATDVYGDRLTKIQPLNPAHLLGIKAGNVFSLFSQDYYPWSEQAWSVGSKVFLSNLIEVRGLGLNYSGGSAFADYDFVTGQTSGATMVVRSKWGAASGVIIGTEISGTFLNGENLLVGGSVKAVAASTAYILTNAKLYYNFVTSPMIAKMPDAAFTWDGIGVKAFGNPDGVLGAAARVPAVDLFGVKSPFIRATVHSAYSRAFQSNSSWCGYFEVDVLSLPNDAGTEKAYGYGVELIAADTNSYVKVFARNCRHPETTNTYPNSAFAFSSVWKRGTVQGGTVTGKAVNTWSAAFDTHEGCIDMTFTDIDVHFPSHGKRVTTQSVGLQNRGINTTIKNFRINGAVIGVYEANKGLTAGFASGIQPVTNYQDGLITGFGLYGLLDDSIIGAIGPKVVLDNLRFRSDGLFTASPWSSNQICVFISSPAEYELHNCKFRDARDAMIRVGAGASKVLIDGGVFDHRNTPAGVTSSNIRLDNAGTQLTIAGKPKILSGSATPNSQPPALVRYAGSAGVPSITIHEDPIVVGRTAAMPLISNTSTATTATLSPSRGRKLKAKLTFNPPSIAAGASLTIAIGYAQFIGYISAAGTMTVTSASGRPLEVGVPIVGPGVPAGISISALGSGTGGAGTYTVSPAPGVNVGASGAQINMQANPNIAGLLLSEASEYRTTAHFSGDLGGLTIAQAWVSADATISVRFTNPTGAAIDAAQGVLTADTERVDF
ncbi:hypothetical protein C1T17_16460 [Sphingobium sp. SCG-1]|uniref:hypothetical protein n=1 Tax=Sphingobium sp. SCG-1 TaxID=2072936 RepID=UPI000CD6B5C5|nr:hypothetical protein [Sphingobium sp. SCG-1]AUW59443.1 hypothetical protein C1T17_16460 [Sphingobium sp. SCG-1]